MKPEPTPTDGMSELLVLPDGKVLVHNLTPAMAELLIQLDPDDSLMQQRASCAVPLPKEVHER